MPVIIEIDAFKEKIDGYKPENASEFHEKSAKMADQAFRLAIKSKQYKRIILLCGGSATGKTEFVKIHLNHYSEDTLIFDSTLSGLQGLQSKLSKVKNKYEVIIIFIQPKNLITSFIIFCSRPRKFHYRYFIRTHSKSRQMFLYALNNYPNVHFRYFISDVDDKSKVVFNEVTDLRQIENEQIDEEVLQALISPFIKIHYKNYDD